MPISSVTPTVNTTGNSATGTGITEFVEFMLSEDIPAPVGLRGFSVELAAGPSATAVASESPCLPDALVGR